MADIGRKTALLLALATAALCGAVASASADVEPNERVVDAEGPLQGGAYYSGNVRDGEVFLDTYLLNVRGPAALDITLEVVEPCWNRDIELSLADADGEEIAGLEPVRVREEEPVAHLRYTTLGGTRRFYLRVSTANSCELGGTYRFRVDPAAAVVDAPRPFADPIALPEPNETPDQAFGPLVGGQAYRGVKGTANDVDWLYFYARGNQPLDLALVSPGSFCGRSLAWSSGEDGIQLHENPYGDFLGWTNANSDVISHIRHTTASGTRKYYVRLECWGGSGDYLIEAGPPQTVVPPPAASPRPTGPSARCRAAIRRRATAKRQLGKRKAALRRAGKPRARRAAKRRVRKAERRLARHRRSVSRTCG